MDKSNDLVSPLTKGPVKFLFSISQNFISDLYLTEANIDVSNYFIHIEEVSVYECIETGYRFFYPFNLYGDGKFYEQLEEFNWYYADWKWDYEVAQDFIQSKSKILDIGCGEGKFLDYLSKNKACIISGLELNEKARQIASSKNIAVLNELIQDHAIENKEKYDIVTFFQVLEHISDVNTFLQSAKESVKKGGKIILTVPNNEPYYLTFDKFHFLNLPPHHMGWWNQKSLSSLTQLFDLKLDAIIKQPLEHYKAYTNSFINENFPNIGFLKSVIYPFLKVFFFINRKRIKGASILAVYTKL